MDIRFKALEQSPLPDNFKDIYKVAPEFSRIFPKAKVEKNMLALSEDIWDFARNSLKDYTMYKTLRQFINQQRAKAKAHGHTFIKIDKAMDGKPKQLTFDETWKLMPDNFTSHNPAFQRVTDLYFKADLSGYKPDERMVNMVDDAIHVFYGAQCNYFVTIDERCHAKATKIYHALKVPHSFLNLMSLLKKWRCYKIHALPRPHF